MSLVNESRNHAAVYANHVTVELRSGKSWMSSNSHECMHDLRYLYGNFHNLNYMFFLWRLAGELFNFSVFLAHTEWPLSANRAHTACRSLFFLMKLSILCNSHFQLLINCSRSWLSSTLSRVRNCWKILKCSSHRLAWLPSELWDLSWGFRSENRVCVKFFYTHNMAHPEEWRIWIV